MTAITTLISNEDCMLAFVIGAAAGPNPVDEKHAALSALASECDIPVIAIHTDLSSNSYFAQLDRNRVLTTRALADPLSDDCVSEAVNDFNRSKLILAGRPSEGVVTFTALSALARGFDVYVIDDLCKSASLHTHQLAMQRLAQAGVVMTTTLQLQTEWCATSPPS